MERFVKGDTWEALISRLTGQEQCARCKKRLGTVQHYEGVQQKLVPTRKWCEQCHQLWKDHARLRAGR